MDELYEKRMRSLLKDEFDAYAASLDQPLYHGLRISPKKQAVETTKQRLPYLEQPSPFAKNTWYISGQHGLDPAHVQGLFYLQEPSAGSAVELLQVQPDDIVLDLCAAPGSKSTQIADHLDGGFLVANEIDAKRAQILLSNLERMGIENMMVTNNDAAALSKELPETFDKILVDAPCSGEGMMKKHEAASEGWSYPNVLLCAARQKDILKEAWKMLKSGGELVYSTCTYAPEENEENIAWALAHLDGCQQLPADVNWGREGVPTEGMDARLVRRIFGMDGGEGHFAARLKKNTEGSAQPLPVSKEKKLPKEAAQFIEEQLPGGFKHYEVNGSRISGMSAPFVKTKKLKVLRQGVKIGEMIKDRFEPAHAFFLSNSYARHGQAKTETTLQEMDDFYHGLQLGRSENKGWRALSYQGIPYGFGKSSAGRITNKLPKGLRLLPGSHLEEEK